MQLRARQEAFRDRSLAALRTRGNTLGIAPTGAGKTVMLSAITTDYTDKGGYALVVQHRDELVAPMSVGHSDGAPVWGRAAARLFFHGGSRAGRARAP